MGLCIYFRSLQPVHPALAFELKERVSELSSKFTWILCDAPMIDHNRDGYLAGSIEPIFPGDEEPAFGEASEASGDGSLMVAIEILSELSRHHAVDWDLVHDYETESIGQIIEGTPEPELLDELESVISIGNMFGDFIDEDGEWDDSHPDNPKWDDADANWRITPVDEPPSLRIENGDPYVLKFPGVK